jgi:hypothetical protein
MKIFIFLTAVLFGCTTIFAQETLSEDAALPKLKPLPAYNWGLLWSGSLDEKTSSADDEPDLSGMLNNKAETTLHYLPLDLLWRGQILGRYPVNLDFDSPWGDPDKAITHYTMGLYHKSTLSRFLLGPLDETGLPARIKNLWGRSPPYAENHNNTIADLRTTVSISREDEVYLYLASPFMDFSSNFLFKAFISAQTEIENLTPALSGGLDFRFPNNKRIMAEMFYTERMIAPVELTPWFSNPPPLPERDFRLFAAGLLYKDANISLSSDFAQSETFAWGSDFYANLGVSLSPPLKIGSRAHPLLISFAADGSGPRFVNRDGAHYAEGFRTAAKIEWRDRYNSLLKLDTVLRAETMGQVFNRSSTGIYYRFPAKRDVSLLNISTISLSANRNAVNHLKINDSYSGNLGINLNLKQFALKNPLRIYLAGAINGTSTSDINPNPYPIPSEWNWESAKFSWEFVWTHGILQLRSKTGCAIFAEKDEKWDFSASVSGRFRQGRLTIKAATSDFPKKWNFSASWRLEIHGKT